jgi:hypothetical protein
VGGAPAGRSSDTAPDAVSSVTSEPMNANAPSRPP